MIQFKQNKVALAVGTALLVMAGAANAAAPSYQGAMPVTAGLGATSAALLHATAGVAGGAGATVLINMLVTTGGVGLSDATFNVNSGAAGSTVAAAADDVFITANGIMIPLAELGGGGVSIQPITTATGANAGAAVAVTQGGAQIAYVSGAGALPIAAGLHYKLIFTLTPAAGKSIRINKLTGALEYSSNAGVTFFPVVATLTKGASVMSDETAVTAIPLAASLAATTTKTGLTLAPTPSSKTFAVAGADKISGLTIDFGQVVTLPTKTTLQLWDQAPVGGDAAIINAVDISNAATTGVTAVTFAATAGSTTSYDVALTAPAAVDWDNSGVIDATDAALYASKSFNTGVNGTGSPLYFKVPATGPAYTNIAVDNTGVAATVATATLANPTDGAAPVLVSAVTDTAGQPALTSKLSLTFSEPVASINAGNLTILTGDLREVAENVKLGADTLAALNLNAGGTLAAAASLSAANQGVVDITGILTADLTGKQVTVAQGVSIKESNDASYVAATPALDAGATTTSGGLTTAASEFLSSAATTTTATPLAIAFNSADTSASAATGTDPTKVGSIIVKFAAGKEVALNATAPAKTLADLAADLVVTVNGLAGQTPVQWQFHPVAADLTLSALGDTLTIAMPTALMYSKMNVTTTMAVGYLSGTTFNNASPIANVLVGKANAAVNVTSNMANAFDGEPVVLPLSATATANTLLTQSVTGTLTGATNGSRVLAYLAKWEDAPAVTVGSVAITGGKVSRTADALANQLAILFAGEVTLNDTAASLNSATASAGGSSGTTDQKAALEAAILANLNAAAAAAAAVPGVSAAAAAVPVKPITVYATYLGNNALGVLTSRVYLSMDRVVAEKVAVGSPVYELSLNPKTGALTGMLTGSLTLDVANSTAARGLVSSVKVAEGLVDAAGKFNLLAGVEPTTADIAKGAAGNANRFLILVHEDQANARKYTQLTSANPSDANYVPFAPNLATMSGSRTVLGAGNNIAAPTVGAAAAVNINLASYKVDTLLPVTTWTLYGAGNPAKSAVAPAGATGATLLPRSFVGLRTDTGAPVSMWTNDAAASADMAMALVGNKVSVATELTNGDTLSTISNASFVNGAVALAVKKSVTPGASRDITFAQAAAPAAGVKVPVGWSLVQVPTGGTLTAATADAVIRVGSQAASQFTWIKATDGAMPTLTASEPVFVYSKLGGAL